MFNARDVGGVRATGGQVRAGVLLRSDAPLGIDADSAADSAAVWARLGLCTAIDLREPIEREHDPVDVRLLAFEGRHQPVIGDGFTLAPGMTLAELYDVLSERRASALTAAVRLRRSG